MSAPEQSQDGVTEIEVVARALCISRGADPEMQGPILRCRGKYVAGWGPQWKSHEEDAATVVASLSQHRERRAAQVAVPDADDLDSPQERLALVEPMLRLALGETDPKRVKLYVRVALDFIEFTAAERAEMRGDAPPPPATEQGGDA